MYDIKCNCSEDVEFKLMEVVEFPVVVVDVKKQKLAAFFHEYVRPTVEAEITPYCTDITRVR